MWSNLAKGLNSTDINATLEKIGNAVAPREDDDDDDDDDFEYYEEDDNEQYYDDDEDYYDDEDFSEEDDDGNRKGIIGKVANVTPFRLADMLTRALDDRQPGLRDESIDGNNSLGNEVNTKKDNESDEEMKEKLDRVLFPKESNQINGYKIDAGDGSPIEPSHEIETIDAVFQGKSQLISNDNFNLYSAASPAEIICQGKTFQSKELNEHAMKSENPVREQVVGGAKNIINPSVTTGTTIQKEVKERVDSNPLISAKTTKEKKLKSEIRNTIHGGSRKKIEDATKANPFVINTVSPGSGREEKQRHANESLSSHMAPGFTNPGSDCTANEESVLSNTDDTDRVVNIHTTSAPKVTGKGATKAPKSHEPHKEVSDNTDLILSNDLISLQVDLSPHLKDQDQCGKLDTTNKEEHLNKNDGIGAGTGKSSKAVSDKPKKVNQVAPALPLSEDKTIPLNTVHGKSGARNDTQLPKIRTQQRVNPPRTTEDSGNKVKSDYKQLLFKLEVANKEIEILQNQAQLEREKAESEKEVLISQFHSKEVRLLQATSEENQNQTLLLQQEFSAKIQHLEQLLEKERRESQNEQAEYKKLLRESYANVDRTESQLKATVSKYENDIAQAKKQEERALRKVDDRMAQTMAVLDERDEEISRLKKSIRNMESKVSEHKEGEEEAEEELEELHHENESLRASIENLEIEKKKFEVQIEALKSGSEELSGLQMELTMLKEERARERTKNQAAADSALVTRAQIESERDSALSELKDSKQQLAAALGDLEIARSDNSRMMTANDNLQIALEAFQDERRAEMEMIDEQRRESEEAIKSAHATATNALKQIHEAEMYEVQRASDNAVKNVMQEMELVQGTVEKLKSENNQMRRSLDEAIHRLQTTQEDVIDRNVMKNILVDWCTLNDKSKRHQVLEIMANLLHFSEDEKEKVHITSKSLDSVRAKVVGALAAPLPPSKADVEHLEGSNVHEKFINFLLAETDDI